MLALTSCDKSYDLHQEFNLKFGNSAIVSLENSNDKIEFIDLIEDTRCPEDVQCPAAGRVGIKLLINDDTEVVLGNADYSSEAYYNDNKIKLLDVTFGKVDNQGKKNFYKALLVIE